MQIQTEPFEDFAILHLQGEFDGFHCARVLQEINDLATAGVTHVALNLRNVRFINSTALGAIIKASKLLKGEDGKLVVTRPSPFCREIMGKIRLDLLVPICESDEEGHRVLFEGREPAGQGGASDSIEAESTLLFTPTDPGRAALFIPAERRLGGRNPVHGHRFGSFWWGVGRLTALHHDGLRFVWCGGHSGLSPFEMGQMLAIGTDLKVKFRLAMLRKGFCPAVVTILELDERTDGVKLEADFKEIDSEALLAVRQYADDLKYLKQELRQRETVCA
jgi:anti-sigma B factor antagonist